MIIKKTKIPYNDYIFYVYDTYTKKHYIMTYYRLNDEIQTAKDFMEDEGYTLQEIKKLNDKDLLKYRGYIIKGKTTVRNFLKQLFDNDMPILTDKSTAKRFKFLY